VRNPKDGPCDILLLVGARASSRQGLRRRKLARPAAAQVAGNAGSSEWDDGPCDILLLVGVEGKQQARVRRRKQARPAAAQVAGKVGGDTSSEWDVNACILSRL
jgi:hypothetical protein